MGDDQPALTCSSCTNFVQWNYPRIAVRLSQPTKIQRTFRLLESSRRATGDLGYQTPMSLPLCSGENDIINKVGLSESVVDAAKKGGLSNRTLVVNTCRNVGESGILEPIQFICSKSPSKTRDHGKLIYKSLHT